MTGPELDPTPRQVSKGIDALYLEMQKRGIRTHTLPAEFHNTIGGVVMNVYLEMKAAADDA